MKKAKESTKAATEVGASTATAPIMEASAEPVSADSSVNNQPAANRPRIRLNFAEAVKQAMRQFSNKEGKALVSYKGRIAGMNGLVYSASQLLDANEITATATEFKGKPQLSVDVDETLMDRLIAMVEANREKNPKPASSPRSKGKGEQRRNTKAAASKPDSAQAFEATSQDLTSLLNFLDSVEKNHSHVKLGSLPGHIRNLSDDLQALAFADNPDYAKISAEIADYKAKLGEKLVRQTSENIEYKLDKFSGNLTDRVNQEHLDAVTAKHVAIVEAFDSGKVDAHQTRKDLNDILAKLRVEESISEVGRKLRAMSGISSDTITETFLTAGKTKLAAIVEAFDSGKVDAHQTRKDLMDVLAKLEATKNMAQNVARASAPTSRPRPGSTATLGEVAAQSRRRAN